MIHGNKIVAVMPAYNAEKTVRRTREELPHDLVDEVVVVDDASSDATVEVARYLGINVVVHAENTGYGANQRTCYGEALRLGADIVVVLATSAKFLLRKARVARPAIFERAEGK